MKSPFEELLTLSVQSDDPSAEVPDEAVSRLAVAHLRAVIADCNGHGPSAYAAVFQMLAFVTALALRDFGGSSEGMADKAVVGVAELLPMLRGVEEVLTAMEAMAKEGETIQ